ncbi:MAG: IS4 family transposase [Burkholderiales bacterium]|nr:IS4 family transposase [Burkholderiales bacterium]
MHQGKLVFAQVMAHLPLSTSRRCVARYDGEHKVKSFSCLDQFYAMAFAQLTFRESLRDIEACLGTQGRRLYHMGFRSLVARNTLANADAVRPLQIYADLAQHLIGIARPLYAKEPIGPDLKETVYAFDSTTIDLCLSVYPWAPLRSTKAAVKLHTLLDVRGSIPSFIHISDGKTRDVNALDELLPEPGAFYLLDRGYMDFARMHALHEAGAFFLIRAKRGLRVKRRYSYPVDRINTRVICDQTVTLEVFHSKQGYPTALRRVAARDDGGKRIVFLINNMQLAAQVVGELYRLRWQVELFFKWIKQHLRIKAFFGTSENAVKTQTLIAVATYVLIAIVKKRAMLPRSLYELPQIFSLTMFETTPINQLLTPLPPSPEDDRQIALL